MRTGILLLIFFLALAARGQHAGPTSEGPRLQLDKTMLDLPCRPGSQPIGREACNDAMSVNVTVDPAYKVEGLPVHYQVSGGRIRGNGSTVVWDLQEMQPGTYSISAEVRSRGGVITKIGAALVIVRECSSCTGDCSCPDLRIEVANDVIKRGQSAKFTALVTGATTYDMTFIWSVEGGKIIKGQGTQTLEVEPFGNSTEVTASVHIRWKGECAEYCKNEESASVKITLSTFYGNRE